MTTSPAALTTPALVREFADLKAAGVRADRPDATRHRENLMNISTQNDRGDWVPAIPEPYFLLLGRARCQCGDTFRSTRRYREHYALVHALGLS